MMGRRLGLVPLLSAFLLLVQAACGVREPTFSESKTGVLNFNGENLTVTYQNFDQDHVVIWGDVLIRRDELVTFDQGALGLAAFGAKDGGFVKLWPSGRVPYSLPANFPASWKVEWDFMIEEWKKAGISWVPRTSTDASYVDVRTVAGLPANMCGSARLGMTVSEPTIFNLRDPKELGNCNLRRTILHESSHVLGFTHEHQRPDRDKFIKPRSLSLVQDITNFGILPNALLHSAFDFNSITLYSSYYLKLDGSSIPEAVSLSSLDIAGAQWRYQSQLRLDVTSVRPSVKRGDPIGKISVLGPADGETLTYAVAFSPDLFKVAIKGDQVLYDGNTLAEPGVYEVWIEAKSAATGYGLLQPVRVEVLPRDGVTPIEISKTTAETCRSCQTMIRTYGAGDGGEWRAPVLMWFYPRFSQTDKHEWTFADGATANTRVVIREFKTPGDFDVRFKVTDAAGKIREERYVFRIQ